jgi:glycosyltransferase involved in cell wall biosynthesis
MKILMVISQFDPIIGGAEKQAQLLAKKLNEKGVGVDLITGWWKFGTPRKEMIDGIRVFRNFCFWGMFGIENNRMIRMLGGILYVISLGTYLFLHGREYDIIHVHQFLYPAFVSALIGQKILKKPVLVKSASSGGTSDIKLLRKVPLGSLQLDFLLKEVEILVAVSKATAHDFKEIGYSESRISYIPNGVEIPIPGKTNYDRVIQVITVTRLSQEKGVDILLRSWTEVVREIGNLRLFIVGDGPLDSQLKALSRSLGIGASVDFVGMVEDASKFLGATDLFVLSSRSEGMSNALLEAMSYGIPCIATQVGGNSELLGAENHEISRGGYILAENGLLINPDDVRGLTEAILFFIRDHHKREEMGRRGRQYIERNHSIDLVAQRYMALYQSLLNKRG